MLRLVVTRGPQLGEEFEIQSLPAVIGRGSDSAVRLRGMQVSRQHAQLIRKDDTVFLQDLGSRNGTRVNNQLVKETDLRDGDQISVCDTELTVRTDEVAAKADEKASDLTSTAPTVAMAASKEAGRADKTMLRVTRSSFEPEPTIMIDAESLGAGAPVSGASQEELDRLNRRLSTMIDVASQLSTIHDINHLLEEIMNRLFRIFPQAERGFILLRDGDSEMVPEIVRRRDGRVDGEVTVSSTVLSRVTEQKKAMLLQDTGQDSDFRNQKSIVAFQIQSMMVAPLLYQGEVLGAVHIDTTQAGQGFSEEDLGLLTGTASTAAVALKNALLVKEAAREATIRTALARHLSPDLVDQYLRGELELGEVGGQVKYGTIFFSDIVGFTAMAERLEDPQIVVELLNHYFAVTEEIIFRYRGTIDKFAGDAIMAYWGVLGSNEDATANAVRAGVEMQTAMLAVGVELAEKERVESLGMGIGINSGNFVAGNIGSDQKIEFTLIGDNVNLAQRIESLATRGQVLISESTYNEVAQSIAALGFTPVTVKNKARPIQVYSVRAVTSAESPDILLVNIPAHIQLDREAVACQLCRLTAQDKKSARVEIVSSRSLEPGTSCEIVPDPKEFPWQDALNFLVSEPVEANGPAFKFRGILTDPGGHFIRFLRAGSLADSALPLEEIARH